MSEEEQRVLMEEAFASDPPPETAEELLVEALECLQAISLRSIQSAQDSTLTETDLRVLLEDNCLDAGIVMQAAADLVDAGKVNWPDRT